MRFCEDRDYSKDCGHWTRMKSSHGQMKEIDRVYAAYPHLNDDAFITENLEKWLS